MVTLYYQFESNDMIGRSKQDSYLRVRPLKFNMMGWTISVYLVIKGLQHPTLPLFQYI